MDGRTFIGQFREETMDEAEGHLWSDQLILRYFSEAQIAFCRQTEGIPDRLVVPVAAQSSVLRLDPRILKIRSATLESRPQERLTIQSVEEAGPVDDSAPGIPRFIVTGLNKGRAEVRPAPSEDVRVVLDVFRLPKQDISGPDDECEVDDLHVPTLMHYALYRAYSRPDPDTMDRVRSQYFREQFDAACVRATREQGRARKPNHVTIFSW